jgi:hypothetical protein
MLRLICPGCRKDSYSSEVELYNICPYCGIKFSGRHGLDKRLEQRIPQDLPVVLSHQGMEFRATTCDISEKGIGICLHDSASVMPGDVLDLTIGNTQVRAKIMWIKKLPNKSFAGLGKIH